MRKQCESGYENLSLKDVERICDRKADKKDFLRGLEMDEIAVKANKFGGGGRSSNIELFSYPFDADDCGASLCCEFWID